MAFVEIERKFLVLGEPWSGAPGRRLVQAYIAREAGRVVRVRVDGDEATVTIKGPNRNAVPPDSSGGTTVVATSAGVDSGPLPLSRTTGDLVRAEVELPVPMDAAVALLALALPGVIEKTRYLVPVGAHVWEIDVFSGENVGLVVAEIELDAPDERFERPSWLGPEVTDDPRYANASLIDRPFRRWDQP